MGRLKAMQEYERIYKNKIDLLKINSGDQGFNANLGNVSDFKKIHKINMNCIK